jgi:hypothetical protein
MLYLAKSLLILLVMAFWCGSIAILLGSTGSSTSVLDKTAGYMDRLMKEAIEIWLNTGNFNRDGGFMLSLAWYPVMNKLSNQKAEWNRASTWLHPLVPIG